MYEWYRKSKIIFGNILNHPFSFRMGVSGPEPSLISGNSKHLRPGDKLPTGKKFSNDQMVQKHCWQVLGLQHWEQPW